jgi:hypothetical protein
MGFWEAGQPKEVARRKAVFDAELVKEGARIAKKYGLNETKEDKKKPKRKGILSMNIYDFVYPAVLVVCLAAVGVGGW